MVPTIASLTAVYAMLVGKVGAQLANEFKPHPCARTRQLMLFAVVNANDQGMIVDDRGSRSHELW